MRLTFLGGADEVGASCTLVENGGRQILVDCGIRIGGREALPHLADIERLDAIVLTHAHLDHAGALPILHAGFPGVPVFATAPTVALLRVMLTDATRVMASRAEADGDLPLYDEAAAMSLLARMQKVPWLDPVPLAGGTVTAQFFPAGHILGAAGIGLEGPEGNVFFSGDVAVADQLTVPGMPVPRFQADVAVVESTYGDRLHASREAEERRLIDRIGETIAAGGKVLVPAFALGRAQEILLILKRAFARKELAPFPVWADGMVKSVCEVYRDFPEDLHVPLRRQMAKSHPFFPEAWPIRKVTTQAEREAVLNGPPCVVVASSGMLTGGASVAYALALAGDRRNLIALTGYQDEESPGRTLLDLAGASSRQLRLGGQTVTVDARVERIGLSAHADRSQLLSLLRQLRPDRVVLVHGEGDARVDLAWDLDRLGEDQIFLPALGQTLDFAARRRSQADRPPLLGISDGAPLDEAALARLADYLRSAPRLVTARDLAVLWWGGSDGQDVPETAIAEVRRLLAGSPHFLADARRPFLFRPAEAKAGGTGDPTQGAPAPRCGPLPEHEALVAVDRFLGPETGLYRRGIDHAAGTMTLAFNFPDIARRAYAGQLAAIADTTGYSVSIRPDPHLGELSAQAQRAIPPEVQSGRAPSVRLERREVCVKVRGGYSPAPETVAAFLERTGFTLVVEADTAPPVSAGKFDDTGRMEVNAALARIDAAFAGLPHSPRRKSKKAGEDGPYLELSFISRTVGGRYAAQIGQLELDTGWSIRVGATADQNAVITVIREALPPSWGLQGSPSLQLATESAKVRLASMPPDGEFEQAAARVAERSGFTLVAEVAARSLT